MLVLPPAALLALVTACAPAAGPLDLPLARNGAALDAAKEAAWPVIVVAADGATTVEGARVPPESPTARNALGKAILHMAGECPWSPSARTSRSFARFAV